MYELPKEQKISMIQANIESQARKVYSLELSLVMQIGGGASESTLSNTRMQIEAQKLAQQSLEDELLKVQSL